jgi:hypothetical protein
MARVKRTMKMTAATRPVRMPTQEGAPSALGMATPTPRATRISKSVNTFPTNDFHGQLTRSPSGSTRFPKRERRAGSKVIERASDTSTTRIAPPARPRKIVSGMISMPASARITVRPLKNTARFAVAPDIPIASSLSLPRARSSRYLDTMNSE